MVARHAVAVVTLLSFSPALAENLDAEAARRFIVGKLGGYVGLFAHPKMQLGAG
jgi:hypothetical protein